MSDAQQYLYLIQPTRMAMLTDGPTPQEDETVSRHVDHLKALADRGIVIFKAESDEAARAIMTNDPAVQAGVMRARLFPYRIALMASRL